MPYYLLIPLAAAILYALGSITVKRALRDGVGMNQSFHLTNVVLGLIFVPVLFFGSHTADWSQLWKPLAMGTTFFAAHWLTFCAIRRGDVSMVTPLMGTKVIFVAITVVLLTGQAPTLPLWIAAGLTTLGIFVMGLADMHRGRHFLFTLAVTLSSAIVFGLSDVLVSTWAADFGAIPFLAIGSGTVGLWSVVMWLFQGAPAFFPSAEGTPWAWTGAFVIAAQAMLMGLGLAYFDDPTGINIMFASRGLWVIVLVLVFGKFLGNREHHEAGLGFLWRITGALLLSVAIVIAVQERSRILQKEREKAAEIAVAGWTPGLFKSEKAD